MERFRPEYHFSPEAYILNDPNGLVYYEGEYHLFHQYNIEEQIHWGHAVSKDLVHWVRLPNALFPDEIGQIWSGSAVADEKNHRLAAFFTYSEHGTGRQSQGLAFSYDAGRTWEKHPRNPVLTHPEKPDFRDPKVFWHEQTQKWVMVLSGGTEALFYGSDDLENWSYLSAFGKGHGSHAGVWECPDLFPLEADGELCWILIVSINQGSPAGGTGMQYFVGQFDGIQFQNANPQEEVLWLDYGKDFYAGVTWNHVPDGRRLMIAWADNWQYRDYLPTEPFKGQMSFVRELKLIADSHNATNWRLKQTPAEEIKYLRHDTARIAVKNFGQADPKKKETLLLPFTCLSQELDLEFYRGNSWPKEFGLKLDYGCGQEFYVSVKPEINSCFVDRTRTGINAHKDFPGKYKGTAECGGNCLRLRMLLDNSQTELFINNGATVMSNLIFPEAQQVVISIYTYSGELEQVKGNIYRLQID